MGPGLFFDQSFRVQFTRGEGVIKYRRKLKLGLADPALVITPRDARGSNLIEHCGQGFPRVNLAGLRHAGKGNSTLEGLCLLLAETNFSREVDCS